MDAWSDDDDFVSEVKVYKQDVPSSSWCGSRLRKSEHKLEKQRQSSDPKVQTSFSITSVMKIVTRLGDEKRKIVQSIGFGGLLTLRSLKMLPRKLVLRLIRNMNAETGEITLPSGERLTVNQIDVHLVLGIPSSGDDIAPVQTLQKGDLTRLRGVLMLQDGDEISLKN